ncbi:bacteriophage abortive infection AbiH family protein [Vreelandella hamiltonii]|uniref:Bacteriophage abortive infection AbiH n=1 Tax=Halomonas johnsoniae TaxID=502832 RepID=A0ABQ2WS36_9GAMM|nr:bacteriophage abortive infection AbiH family protein [Halomonas johnsoniae]GGW65502.1 hypothetical protein GCM10007158_27790 [Halomonas johnsoniae]
MLTPQATAYSSRYAQVEFIDRMELIKMSKLYVIGNGFDLYHNLNTRYSTFGVYLKENYTDIYGQLVEYFGLPDLDDKGECEYNYTLWADFEGSLSLLDQEVVLDAHSNSIANLGSPGFRDRDWGAFAIDIESVVNNLTLVLFKAFSEFIRDIDFPSLYHDLKLNLDKNAIYINFNYTDTLERYYGISRDNILYIHGKANELNENLILGHGVDPNNFNSEGLKQPEGLSGEESEIWIEQMADSYDHSFELGKDALFQYFLRSYKNTKEIIELNASLFDSLTHIREIIILGHSLSKIDLPYMKKISVNLTSSVIWSVSYYGNNEKERHKRTLTGLGVESDKIRQFKLYDLI